jgi:drug/metabolite transporter (DMT)-like permease
MGWQSWAAALVAAAGVCLLGVNDDFQIESGDALEILGAVLWALHVVAVGRAVKHVEVFSFSVGQYFVAGALNVVLGLILEADTFPALRLYWWTVVYLGVISVAIGYTLQAVGQKHAPAADAAVILSMEAVFAALFGYFLLHEPWSPRKLLGCVMILSAIVLVQFKDAGEH